MGLVNTGWPIAFGFEAVPGGNGGCFPVVRGAKNAIIGCKADGGEYTFPWGSDGTFYVGTSKLFEVGPLLLYRPDGPTQMRFSLGDLEGGRFVPAPMLRASTNHLLIGGSSKRQAAVIRVHNPEQSPTLDIPHRIPLDRKSVV